MARFEFTVSLHVDEYPTTARIWAIHPDDQKQHIGSISTILGINYEAIDCNGSKRSFANENLAKSWIQQQFLERQAKQQAVDRFAAALKGRGTPTRFRGVCVD